MKGDYMNRETELINLIENGPSFKKISCIKELFELTGLNNINLYKKLLADRDWHVRVEAAVCISKALEKDARPFLEPLLQDKAYGVREDVRKILSNLTD